MTKRNEEGFQLVISYPYDTKGMVQKAIIMPEKPFWALANSLNLHPINKEAHFGWSDYYGDNGYYLYIHDDDYSLLTIPLN